MHFLKRSTHFSKMCCRPFITSRFVSELPFHDWKSPEIAWNEIWIEFCVWLGKSGSVEPHTNMYHTYRSWPMQFLSFSNHEKGAPRQEISKSSTVCSAFSRSEWSVVRSASLAKGDTPKMRPSPHLHKVPTRSNKVSPWTFQTALVVRNFIPLFLKQSSAPGDSCYIPEYIFLCYVIHVQYM
jgi:hypothetical protein